MNILFVHQCFPGQYRHIIRSLSKHGNHNILALGIAELSESIPPNLKYFRYSLFRGNTPGVHDWLLDIDSKLIRGEGCAHAAFTLSQKGFIPDIICAHPGWGEALFLRDIWPEVPLLCYQEYFYNSSGFDSGFDPEFVETVDWRDTARLRMKNANPLLMLETSSWNVTPTKFQQSSFPIQYQSRISVIHDGIDTNLASPNSSIGPLVLDNCTVLDADSSIVTFVNRSIEPHRGCHTFIRSIPDIQSSNPNSIVVVVGATEGVSYGKAGPNNCWMDVFLSEIKGNYDPSKVFFAGSLSYQTYIHLLQLSSCHVYLTYPFVLSWSLLEALSIGLPVVASSTQPVQEVITDGYNGLLVDFFSPAQLSQAVTTILKNRELAHLLGRNSRDFILQNYSLDKCIPRQLQLIDLVASRILS